MNFYYNSLEVIFSRYYSSSWLAILHACITSLMYHYSQLTNIAVVVPVIIIKVRHDADYRCSSFKCKNRMRTWRCFLHMHEG